MLARTPFLVPLFLVPLFLAGCGGGEGGTHDPIANFAFTAQDSSYNGASELTVFNDEGSATGSVAGGITTLHFENGARHLDITFTRPAGSDSTLTLDFSDTGNADAEYGEGSGPASKSWIAGSGTLTLTFVSATSTAFAVNGVVFARNVGIADNIASGSFTVAGSGTVTSNN